ncbi:MAG: hypothetical protein HUJ63_07190 [Enterococcus sp.]|nr:hypothetical protein [Enterococcus sp.]
MADSKTDYTGLVNYQKNVAENDREILESIVKGYYRKEKHGQHWEEVDINDVVNEIAPGSKPIIENNKIIYYNKDKTKAVVADVGGYLRVENRSANTRWKQYLDKHGNNAFNKIDEKGRTVGKSKAEFNRTTHYMIKKRKDM